MGCLKYKIGEACAETPLHAFSSLWGGDVTFITITSNKDQLFAGLDDVQQRQVPWAMVLTLNEMAQEVLKGVQSDMDKHFDRPTRWTKNAFGVYRATKQRLYSEVKEKPSVSTKHYLKVQERGGGRPKTGIERNFDARLPFDGMIAALIPATGGPFDAAKLDAFGNWSNGERNEVMSQLKVGRDVGFNSNKSDASAKRRTRRGGATYFVASRGLAPGVYRRKSPDDTPVRVLKFARKAPVYKRSLGFIEGAEARVRKTFAERFARHLAAALADRKP